MTSSIVRLLFLQQRYFIHPLTVRLSVRFSLQLSIHLSIHPRFHPSLHASIWAVNLPALHSSDLPESAHPYKGSGSLAFAATSTAVPKTANSIQEAGSSCSDFLLNVSYCPTRSSVCSWLTSPTFPVSPAIPSKVPLRFPIGVFAPHVIYK